MSFDDIVHRLTLEGLSDADARSTVRAVVRELGRCVGDRFARVQIATALPVPLDSDFSSEPPGDCGRHELFARIAASERLPLGQAAEQTEIACRVVGLALPSDIVTQLHAQLPEELVDLFRGREVHTPPVPHANPVHKTLADGGPGSSRPVSEAEPASRGRPISENRPGSTHPLSHSPPKVGERSLAEGRPGGTHPLSDSKPGGPTWPV